MSRFLEHATLTVVDQEVNPHTEELRGPGGGGGSRPEGQVGIGRGLE